MIESLVLDFAEEECPHVFRCLDQFMDCVGEVRGERPHEKVRFAVWTMVGQGGSGHRRLSLERALPRLRLDPGAGSFAPLVAVLREAVESPA